MIEHGRVLLFMVLFAIARTGAAAGAGTEPLVIGDSFKIESKVLGETRRINVYPPPGYAGSDLRVPVLYMPDGGLAEDFLHVAGLVEVLVGDNSMRPFLLVGIENTERRRDLTPPTDNAEDKKIAPRVGGSAAFRKFIREELMPQIKQRYRTTDETAIVGESLAGLFVVETFFLEPDLFDTYIAIDPSLWWDDHKLVDDAAASLYARPRVGKSLYLAASSEQRGPGDPVQSLADILRADAHAAGVRSHYEKMPEEKHATIYHPAALKAFRAFLKPGAQPAAP
ncbi:MAG TPA: alpha/beta hydrolase-fold protein [Rhodanobacteraceae bacterium]